jgi:hypothetical protein
MVILRRSIPNNISLAMYNFPIDSKSYLQFFIAKFYGNYLIVRSKLKSIKRQFYAISSTATTKQDFFKSYN